jgi:hypothetical protein
MKLAGSPSWQMTVEDRSQALDIALFVRAAAGFDPPLDPPVPPLAAPISASVELDRELIAAAGPQWAGWWTSLLHGRQNLFHMVPPDFSGLTATPQLQALVALLFPDAARWSNDRKAARPIPPVGIEGDIVREAEREGRRRAAPFRLRVVELPVRGRWSARLSEDHLLVSAGLRALRPMVEALL